jgi:hypothetical protein
MATKKRSPNKAKTTKPKKAKPSQLEKAMRSLPPIDKDFQKVLDNKPGYGPA